MREYMPKQLHMEREVYRQAISVVRRYDDMCRKVRENERNIIYASPVFRGDGGITRPTESKALKIDRLNAEMGRQIKAVDQALILLDADARSIVLNHIMRNAPLKRKGIKGRDRTMERCKQQFVYTVAQNLDLV